MGGTGEGAAAGILIVVLGLGYGAWTVILDVRTKLGQATSIQDPGGVGC